MAKLWQQPSSSSTTRPSASKLVVCHVPTTRPLPSRVRPLDPMQTQFLGVAITSIWWLTSTDKFRLARVGDQLGLGAVPNGNYTVDVSGMVGGVLPIDATCSGVTCDDSTTPGGQVFDMVVIASFPRPRSSSHQY